MNKEVYLIASILCFCIVSFLFGASMTAEKYFDETEIRECKLEGVTIIGSQCRYDVHPDEFVYSIFSYIITILGILFWGAFYISDNRGD